MEEIIINIPSEAKTIIDILEHDGYEAYIVGGCVRDSLMGKTPHDWDICTSALPEQVMESLKTYETIPTGLKHGTVAIIINGEPYEVTTYRVDGEYKDNRRPESVEFVSDLKKDLERRDFTINAMAYNPKNGLIDLFGGREDIKNKVIKCVGNADDRFKEDALRIMRALRFAIRFGFNIEHETEESLRNNIDLLKNISIERITSEFTQILKHPIYSLQDKELLYTVCSCVEKALGQSFIFSANDVDRLFRIPYSSLPLRLAVLFDFYNISEVEEKLTKLRFPNADIRAAVEIRKLGIKLISNVDNIDTDSIVFYSRCLRRDAVYCGAYDIVLFASAIDPPDHRTFTVIGNEILHSIYNNDPVQIKDLAVDGNDMMDLRLIGASIKIALEALLEEVMLNNIRNTREDLLEKVKEIICEK